MSRAWRIGLALSALAAGGAGVSLALGSRAIAPLDLLRVLFVPDGSIDAQIVHQLRLPRVLAAFGTGGLLALAGALMQGFVAQPAGRSVRDGASGGAAIGALGAMLLGAGGLLIQGGAFGGALASTVLVFALARREFAGASLADPGSGAPRLLLAGVMLAALWTAGVTLLLTVAPEARIRGMLFWLAGDLSSGSGGTAAWATLAVLTLGVWPLGRSLNVMLRGPIAAQALGVRVQALRRALFVLASLATAVAGDDQRRGGLRRPGRAARAAPGHRQRPARAAARVRARRRRVAGAGRHRRPHGGGAPAAAVGLVTALLGVPSFLVLLLRRRDDGAAGGARSRAARRRAHAGLAARAAGARRRAVVRARPQRQRQDHVAAHAGRVARSRRGLGALPWARRRSRTTRATRAPARAC
jgi:ABC-type Fe3+-siderophore transport system permease subunit